MWSRASRPRQHVNSATQATHGLSPAARDGGWMQGVGFEFTCPKRCMFALFPKLFCINPKRVRKVLVQTGDLGSSAISSWCFGNGRYNLTGQLPESSEGSEVPRGARLWPMHHRPSRVRRLCASVHPGPVDGPGAQRLRGTPLRAAGAERGAPTMRMAPGSRAPPAARPHGLFQRIHSG
jgi:hypothetical protein